MINYIYPNIVEYLMQSSLALAHNWSETVLMSCATMRVHDFHSYPVWGLNVLLLPGDGAVTGENV